MSRPLGSPPPRPPAPPLARAARRAALPTTSPLARSPRPRTGGSRTAASRLALALGFALGTLPCRAPRAQPTPNLTQADIDRARRFMDQGQAFYGEKRYAEAAEAFRKAHELQPFPAFLFNQGVCHEKLGEHERALEIFQRYLAADPSAPDADAVRARIKRLESQRKSHKPTPDEATPEATRSTVVINTNPTGAFVQLWRKVAPDAPPLPVDTQGQPAGWQLLAQGPSPLMATSPAGSVRAVVPATRNNRRSETALEVAAGRVHQLNLDLSQAEFMGYLRVTSEVAAASIYLDDPPPHRQQPWGSPPHGELVPPGRHTIWVEAPGYETFSQEITLEAGQRAAVEARLERVNYGFLRVDGNTSGVRVTLDDQPVGVFNAEDGPLRIKATRGVHRLRVEAEGRKPFDAEVDVPAGQSRDVYFVLMARPSRTLGWGAAASAAAAVGAGVYFGLRANELHADLQRDRAAGLLAADDPRASSGKTMTYLANGGFALGGLLAGLSLYGFLRDPLPPSSVREGAPIDLDPTQADRRASQRLAPLRFSVAVTPGHQAFSLWGAF